VLGGDVVGEAVVPDRESRAKKGSLLNCGELEGRGSRLG
jgi:hypothetical protein